MARHPPIHGLMAEFESATELVRAAQAAREAGYRRLDAYSPFPVEGLAEALGFTHTGLPRTVFIGGLIGCIGGFLLQYYGSAIDYPLISGRKPADIRSWPAFIPITFETTVLVAALTAVLGMLALNGLPMPYHPVFHVPRFVRATQDSFFLCIDARDPLYDPVRTYDLLKSLGPREISEVPR